MVSFKVLPAGGFAGGGIGGFLEGRVRGGGRVFSLPPPGGLLAAELLMELFECRPAPAAAGAGGEAIGDLRCVLRPFGFAESLDLA